MRVGAEARQETRSHARTSSTVLRSVTVVGATPHADATRSGMPVGRERASVRGGEDYRRISRRYSM
jgi:hypothetical protein